MEPNTILVDAGVQDVNQPFFQWVGIQNPSLDESTQQQSYRFLLESVKEAGAIIGSFIGLNVHLDIGLVPFEQTQQMYFKAIYKHPQTYDHIADADISVFQIIQPTHALGYKKIQCLINGQFVCFSLGIIGNLVNRLGYEIFNSIKLSDYAIKLHQQSKEAQNDAIEAFESLMNTPVNPITPTTTIHIPSQPVRNKKSAKSVLQQVYSDMESQVVSKGIKKRGRPKKKNDDPDYIPKK